MTDTTFVAPTNLEEAKTIILGDFPKSILDKSNREAYVTMLGKLDDYLIVAEDMTVEERGAALDKRIQDFPTEDMDTMREFILQLVEALSGAATALDALHDSLDVNA